MNEQGPQVCVAAPADAVQAWLAARRILSGHEAQPGGQMPAVAKLCLASPTAATTAVAVIGPIPGISAIFLQSVDFFMNDWIDASMREASGPYMHEKDDYPHLPGLHLQRFQFNGRLDAGEPAAPRTSAARSCNVF
jgi:hypothetical protein